MKKRILSIILSIVMLVGLLPSTALAMMTDVLYIGGVGMGNGMAATYYKNGDTTTTGLTGTADGWNAKFEGNTLWLNGLIVTASDVGETDAKRTGIYSKMTELTINMAGDSSVTGASVTDEASYGIYFDAVGDSKLTITGSGSLTAKGGDVTCTDGKTSRGIYMSSPTGRVIVESGTLNANGGTVTGSSWAVSDGILGALTVNGGTVNATGGTSSGKGHGIWTNAQDLTVTGGTVNAVAGTVDGTASYAVNTKYVDVSGGTLTATGGTAENGYSCGISVDYDGTIAVSGSGKLEAMGGKAKSESGGIFNQSTSTITVSDNGILTALGGSVTYESDGSYSCGIYNGNVTVSGGTLTATGGDTGNAMVSCGLYETEVSVTGGTLIAQGGSNSRWGKAGYSCGIYGDKERSVTGGTLTAIGGYSRNGDSYGCYYSAYSAPATGFLNGGSYQGEKAAIRTRNSNVPVHKLLATGYGYYENDTQLDPGTNKTSIGGTNAVIVKQTLPLTFTDSETYDIPASTAGTAIDHINLSGAVSGGLLPYTFSAEGLPAGISISAKGIISGTPATADDDGGTAAITVTDNAEATASITIAYGAISEAPPHIHDMSVACGGSGVTYTPWDGTTDLSGGNVYLTGDATPTETITVTGTVNLCLNGHSITSSADYAIEVSDGAVLNLCDCKGSGTVSGDDVGIYSEGGTVNVYGGTVNGEYQGIYNYYENSTVNIYGGTVNGVIEIADGSVTVSGGIIDAIFNYSDNTFTLSGAPTINGEWPEDYAEQGAAGQILLAEGAVITIGDTLTCANPISVMIMDNNYSPAAGTFTSGWTTMNDAEASDYFDSAVDDYIVQLNSETGELELAERPSHYHPVCGDDECGDHGADIAWTEWTSTTSLPTSSGNYYLSDDVTISSTWSPQNGTVLCLNGKTITMSNSGASDIQDVITIGDGVTFTLTDCQSTVGKITHTDVGYGRGVNVAAGTFNMYGGSITGNTNSLLYEVKGGGVYVGASGIFNLYGGSISGNEVKLSQSHQNLDRSYGGGVYVDGTFNMNGGNIANNTTTNSGGGACVAGGTFNMDGGSISENLAGSHGGGVYFRSNGGTFKMNGGSIAENSAAYYGGGVYTYYGCTFNMVGGSISDNNATHDGGGVYVYGAFNLRGEPTISENTAHGSGNNVSVSANRNINVVGALTNTTPIGVTNRDSGTGRFAVPSGDVTTLAEGYADKFTSDNPIYDVIVDGVNLKLAQIITVSFDANGGNGTMEAVQVENGSSYTLPTCGFITPEGKQFKGWATSATGEVISTSEITIEGATTLYAIWEDIPTTCTVTFNMNGHGEQIAAATVCRDEKVTKPADPTATGYTFGGWYEEQACTTAWDFATDTVSANTTLYAKWTANTYSVTLNTNGATINNNNVTSYTYGVGATLPAAGDMTKASHRFDGWYESDDFSGSPVTAISTTATGDKTYYAKWTEVHDIEVTVLDTNNSPLSGVKVKLMQGSTQFGEEKTTDTDGKITFTAVPLGSYNVVAEQTVSGGTKTKTELVILEHTDATLTITMPDENVSSTLAVTGNDTPDVVVGGLDDEAADQTYSNAADQNTHVSIGMSIESKEDVTSGGSGSSEEASQQTTIKQAASAQQLDKVEFLSITVTKTVTTNGAPDNRTELEQTQTVLELIIPYSLVGKYNIGIYRHHDGRAEAFAALNSKPGEQAKRDKTFWIDTGKELIHIYTNRFSNYAIAYSDAPVVTPTPNPTPSGGGSYAHACMSKCSVCGGCTDAKCTERACAVKCKLITMGFEDVTEALWCYDAVTYVYHHGLMQGYGDNEFYPDGTVTRQQVWMILARMSGADPKSMTAARLWAMETGISDGTDPTAYVTRQQFITMLWRYAKDMGWDVSVGEDTNILSYNDAFSVAEYAIPAMQWACGEGIIAGKTSANGMILAPKSNATRGQLATMMMRFCTKIAN